MKRQKQIHPANHQFDMMVGACALTHLLETDAMPTRESGEAHLPGGVLWLSVFSILEKRRISLGTLVDETRENARRYLGRAPTQEDIGTVLAINIALLQNPDLSPKDLKVAVPEIIGKSVSIAMSYTPDTTRFESVKDLTARRVNVIQGLMRECLKGSTLESLENNLYIGNAPSLLPKRLEELDLPQLAEKMAQQEMSSQAEFKKRTSLLVERFMAAAKDDLNGPQKNDPQIVTDTARALMIRALTTASEKPEPRH